MAKLLTGRVKDASKSDEFVRMPFAAAISNLLLNHDRNDLPVICGVFAPWGAGKSTFMRQMEKAVFAESNKNKAIWFEPWRYESSQDLAAALLLKLSSEIQKTGVDVEIRDAAKAVGLSVVKAFGRAAVKATDRMVGIPVVEAGIEGLKEFRKAEDEEQLGYQPNIDKTIKKFGEVVRDWVGDDSLVIFVDDLDRCLPDHMVRLLEGLHLYLSGIPCIAVVGIDRQAIEAAIRERYSGKIEEVGRHYIDKIFHTAFSLPRPSEDAITAKYGGFLKDMGIEGRRRQPVDLACSTNPRNYERFLNQFLLAKVAAETQISKLTDEHLDVLTITAAMRVAFPDFMSAVTDCGTKALQVLVNGVDKSVNDLARQLDQIGGDQLFKYSHGNHPVEAYIHSLDAWAVQKLRTSKQLPTILSLAEF